MTIHNAVAKKTENHLQKKIRFKDSIITQREFIEVLIKDGYSARVLCGQRCCHAQRKAD